MTICPDARETILTSDSETETNGAGLSVTYQDVVKLVLSEKYCHAGGLLPYYGERGVKLWEECLGKEVCDYLKPVADGLRFWVRKWYVLPRPAHPTA